MGEDEPHHMLECTKCNEPFPVSFDSFGWFGVSKMELEVSKLLWGLVVYGCQVDSREDTVKVNCLSLQNFDPLWIREFRQSPGTE